MDFNSWIYIRSQFGTLHYSRKFNIIDELKPGTETSDPRRHTSDLQPDTEVSRYRHAIKSKCVGEDVKHYTLNQSLSQSK